MRKIARKISQNLGKLAAAATAAAMTASTQAALDTNITDTVSGFENLFPDVKALVWGVVILGVGISWVKLLKRK